MRMEVKIKKRVNGKREKEKDGSAGPQGNGKLKKWK